MDSIWYGKNDLNDLNWPLELVGRAICPSDAHPACFSSHFTHDPFQLKEGVARLGRLRKTSWFRVSQAQPEAEPSAKTPFLPQLPLDSMDGTIVSLDA